MNVQRLSSVLRQVIAVLVTVYGVLSASMTALHLPVAVAAVPGPQPVPSTTTSP